VPITLTIVRCLIVESAGQRYAIPAHSVARLLPHDTDEAIAAGRQFVMNGPSAIPVSSLASVLRTGSMDSGAIVVLAVGPAQHAFRVDHLVGERDLVIKGLGELLPRIEGVAGAAIEADGDVIVELDVAGLFELAGRAVATPPAAAEKSVHRPSVLVVDDAMTIRELERSILEGAGYAVRVATDGEDALRQLQRQPSDLVLTDIEMPAMDGFTLIETIRRHPRLGRTPIVILTSHESEGDRQRGLAAGADAYVIKKGFDQQRLISLVEQLLLGGAA
jgi:two-component system chemotaxis sensor kinase CheA